MAYFNEEFNSMLHKRQEGPAAGNTNNANSQPFPNLPPSPNNEPATQKNGGGGGIGKFQLIGIIAGAVIVLGLIIGIFIRKKVVRERTARNVIKINDVEWDSNTSAGKPTRAIPPQQLRDVYNGQNIGEKSQPTMMIKNSPPLSSPQFSNFSSRDQDDASTINISSPLDTPTKSEFPLSDSQRRFQKPSKGHYQHLPRSPRSPLIFKNKTGSTDSDSDQDTLEGTPRSPYFYKGEPSINDQDNRSLEEPPRSPYFYKGGPVPTNTNDQDSTTYLDVNNNNYNYEKKNNNINHDENDIIMPPNSDLDNNLKNNNKQYANDLSPSNDDTLAPNSFKISWIKDPSYFSKVFTPKEQKESSQTQSQTNSVYSTNSIGKNENVQMDYVKPTQGMIQIEMMDNHVITKNDIPKETVITNFYYTEEEHEFDSPQSEYMAIEYMPVDHESQIVAQLNKMQKIESIENEFVKSNQTNMNMEISAPIITGTTKPEILASKPVKPVVVPISSISTSPMYDIDKLKRHAEKVLNAKTEKKEEEGTEDKSSSNEGTQEKPLVRKKSVRFQAGLDNDETRPDNDEPLDVSNPVARKSILMDIMRQSLKPEYNNYEPEDEEEVNNRGSTSSTSSYQVYDFDISSYQDNTDAKVANYL